MNAKTDTLSAQGRAALAYAGRGWRVFPILAGHKGETVNGRSTHHLPNGHNGASCDIETVRVWWRRWPDANIGLHLAASGLVAVDADSYKPDCGFSAFMQGRDMPETLVQKSARGGAHYIFLAEEGEEFPGKLCDGVDIKHKGYILLEPSTFEGGVYEFQTDDAPAPCPLWLPRKKLSERAMPPPGGPRSDNGRAGWAETALRDELNAVVNAVEGERNSTLNRAAFSLAQIVAGGGLDETMVRNRLLGAALTAGLRQDEALKTIASGFAAGLQQPRSPKERPAPAGQRSQRQRPHEGDEAEDDAQPFRREEDFDLSHDALALELGARSWDRNAKYVATWGKWLFWTETGTHWRKDDRREDMTRVRLYLRTRAQEFAAWAEREAAKIDAEEGEGKSGRFMAWAKAQATILRSKTTVAAVETMAQSNPASAARSGDFDADLLILGTPGGVVDLRSGELRPARREDMVTKQTAIAPAPKGSAAPVWTRFLNDVFEGDQDIISFMQRAAGYALTGETTEHKLLFLYGSGRNGKSTFLDALQWIWGDYARRAPASAFLYSPTPQHSTDIAGLHGARLVVGSELPKGKVWDEAVIKDLTGGEKMTARFMRQDNFDFDPQLTLMIAGNNMPSFRGVDEAIRARVVLVPFTVTIPPERRDTGLKDKLRAEAPEILRWAVEGALEWRRRGLDVPAKIAAASQAYFDDEDTLGQFLADETVIDRAAFTTTTDLHQRFRQWTEKQGLNVWTSHTFTKELKGRGFQDARRYQGRGFMGLRLA